MFICATAARLSPPTAIATTANTTQVNRRQEQRQASRLPAINLLFGSFNLFDVTQHVWLSCVMDILRILF
jgi:hypothetical protein